MWKPYEIIEQIRITAIYSMFESICENGYSFNGESHDFWECLYVLDGEVVVSGDERVYKLSSGEIIFHKPLEMHKFHVENPLGARIFVFSFAMDGSIANFFKDKVFFLADKQTNVLSQMLSYIEKICGKNLSEGECDATLHWFNLNKTYPQMLSTYIYQLFLSLYDNNAVSDTAETPQALIFKKAVECMNSRMDENPSVEDIAQHCNISTTGLKRIFCKFAGFGIHKYFLKLKINTAMYLLSEGKNVTEVAETLGFGSQGYFSFVFKRETGKSPTEYIKTRKNRY